MANRLTWWSSGADRRRSEQTGCSGSDRTILWGRSGRGRGPSGGSPHTEAAARTDALQGHIHKVQHWPHALRWVKRVSLAAFIHFYQCCCNTGRLSPGRRSQRRPASPSLHPEPTAGLWGLRLLPGSGMHHSKQAKSCRKVSSFSLSAAGEAFLSPNNSTVWLRRAYRHFINSSETHLGSVGPNPDYTKQMRLQSLNPA